jgi:type I restriction enzyme S subunit
VKKLKHFCSVFPSNVDKHARDGERAIRLCNYTDVYYNDQITAGMPFMEATATDDQIAKFSLRAGDTIITKDSESAADIAVSAYVPEDLPDVICGYHLSMIRPHGEISGSFVKRLFDSRYAKSRFAVSANGLTRVGLGQYALDNVEFPLPPMEEQSDIAAFLDRETSKIDALIAEKERLLELLAEKREALISHAVTKGLNPDVPMKDSGVTWLGEIPSHWAIRSISSVSTKITNGYVGPTRDILVDEGIRYLQSLHIKGNQIRFDPPYFVTDEWSREHSKSILQVGDVLIVQTGAIGQSAVVTEDFSGCNCHALIIVSPVRDSLEGAWLSWVLNSSFGVQSLLSIQTGALHPHLNCGNVKQLFLPLPPISEQGQIISWLDKELASLDALSNDVSRGLSLLAERRLALIAATVTGQIDVREVA